MKRVLLALTPLFLISCQATTQLGPLTLAGESWLIRPGSPSNYLRKELQTLVPETPSPEDRQLFISYSENDRSLWSPRWLSQLDFTGVAWNGSKAGTLIHPQFVVFASHFQRLKGETLTFHDRAGNPIHRKIADKATIHRIANPDITVAKLDQPVPSTITHYPLLPPSHDYRVLNGAPLIVTDKERKVHLFRINRVNQDGYEQIGARQALGHEFGASWGERLERGDSGHPSFVLVRRRLVLVSTLKGGGWESKGAFYGGDRNQRAILAAIERLNNH